MKRVYGNTSTSLTLTAKARKFYNETDPLRIEETDTADGMRYSMSGVFTAENLTDAELNAELEALADAIAEE